MMKLPQITLPTIILLCSLLSLQGCGGGGSGGGSTGTGGTGGGIVTLSTNASLSNLTISAGALDQTFESTVTNYTANVTNVDTTVMLTATAEDSDITGITINGVAEASGTASTTIDLALGENNIDVVVTAEDGSTELTYSITITRPSAFTGRDGEWVIFLADKETDDITELYAVSDDNSGSEPIKLSEPLIDIGMVIDFAVSPDKTLIAYLASQEAYKKYELYVLPVDAGDSAYKTGTAYKVSGALDSSEAVKSFAWSPDSSKLVFLANADVIDADELFMVGSDGSNLHKINGSISGVVEIGEFAWSDDSRYVAYKVYNLDAPAEVIGINSHDGQALSSGDPGYSVRLNPTLASGGSVKSFAWVPNSNLVSYLADQDVAGQDELFYGTASVSQVSTQLSHTLDSGASVTDHTWSPDGSYVAYIAETAAGHGLYTSQVGGASGVSLSSLLEIIAFSWSPDSQYVGYLGGSPSRGLHFSAADGTSNGDSLSSALTPGGHVRRFQWSPDSNAVSYLADQDTDETFELYMSTLDDSITGQKISGSLTTGGDVQAFAWSPDSQLVAYRADANTEGVDELFTSHVDGDWIGNRISVQALPNGNHIGTFSFAWASNSSALTYQAAETSSGVVELYGNLADGSDDSALLSGTLVNRGDVTEIYHYNSGPQLPVTQQVKVTNLFKNASFRVDSFYGSELCGVVYEPVGDALLVINCDHGGTNDVLKYSFDTQLVSKVYEYTSQHDYGMRLFDDELWIVRTYDEGLLRLTDLQNDTLTLVDSYFGDRATDELNEIYDVALSEGDLYFVAGNVFTSDHHNGIQRVDGSTFSMVSELVSDTDAAWSSASGTSGYTRFMVAVGVGASANLIVATGRDGDIERWDLSGNRVNSVIGFGDLYLQKDSMDRVYAVPGAGTVMRWQADLGMQETFNFDGTQSSGNRFVLRERDTEIDVIITSFRQEEPIFNLLTVIK